MIFIARAVITSCVCVRQARSRAGAGSTRSRSTGTRAATGRTRRRSASSWGCARASRSRSTPCEGVRPGAACPTPRRARACAPTAPRPPPPPLPPPPPPPRRARRAAASRPRRRFPRSLLVSSNLSTALGSCRMSLSGDVSSACKTQGGISLSLSVTFRIFLR
jgi:hypothetical protein